MKKGRTKLEIFFEVLSAVRTSEEYFKRDIHGAKGTVVMYKSHLSSYPFSTILDFVMGHGLVEDEDVTLAEDKRVKKLYTLTEPGENLVNHYIRLRGRDVSEIHNLVAERVDLEKLESLKLYHRDK